MKDSSSSSRPCGDGGSPLRHSVTMGTGTTPADDNGTGAAQASERHEEAPNRQKPAPKSGHNSSTETKDAAPQQPQRRGARPRRYPSPLLRRSSNTDSEDKASAQQVSRRQGPPKRRHPVPNFKDDNNKEAQLAPRRRGPPKRRHPVPNFKDEKKV